ncbi:UDP-N-acetylmuramate dehydrogenase [Candidatus Gottesmanbacteria bacterium]|nr:UDP-N-acetylmuramate dehydrogenase [Candidatus Gottesmanbacteria bacterium]
MHDVSLASLSTFGIGGLASMYVAVRNPKELEDVVLWAKSEKLPFQLVAGGSNIVFPDEGLQCLVIHNHGESLSQHDNVLIVDSGVELSNVISFCITRGFSGVEYLSGIPGTIGGAVVGNAGAYGHAISEVVEYVEVLNGKKIEKINNQLCGFRYRESIFKRKSFVLLRICIRLTQGVKKDLRKVSSDVIKQRETKYHPGIRCPGSFFKNVLEIDISKNSLSRIDQNVIIAGKIPAGFLLGEVGARGMKIGGIKIADYHGNLFVNTGSGTAKDVKKLAQILKKRVLEKFHIQLEEEIRYF